MIYDNQDGDRDLTKWDTVETLFLVGDIDVAGAAGIKLGEKVTTVNLEDVDTTGAAQILNFDDALTAATLGVNKVINSGAAGTIDVTNGGTALKTLTVDASGKASSITLANTAADIETLNITGKAGLTLGALLTTITTVDGSKAQGNLTFTNTAAMTSIKTGSGNDTVTVAAAVASGETINLGAGNDKLVKSGAGVVNTSTTTVIDGGAGIDSLDSALVTVGNAGVFANFETLSLTTAADLDLALVNKSTFTTIAIDAAINSTVRNVSTSQSLAVNATGTSTTLLFKDVAGTADAYTINFNADNTAATNAGTVSIAGIETVTVNSVGKTGVTNTINLTDADAKSLVITGDKALTLLFTAFGTDNVLPGDGKGVTTIDASASTAGITITDLSSVGEAENGLTIKGGAGVDNITSSLAYGKAITIEAGAGDDIINTTNLTATANKIIVNGGAGNDIITVGSTGGTLTGGAGNDTFVVTAATAGAGFATTPVITTITDIEKGDKISVVNSNVLLTKANISGVANLDAALGIAATTTGTNTWFQYGSDTYLVVNTTNGLDATDVIVKLNGLVDLSTSTVSGTVLEIA